MAGLTKLEQEYVRMRVIHSLTAQHCWKLRARLDAKGLTAAREQELNEEFGRQMQRGSK